MAGSDFRVAGKLRDAIVKIVRTEVAKLAPPTRVGTVEQIDTTNNKCWVRFPGDDTPLKVSMTYGNQPRYAEYNSDGTPSGVEGDLVRVGGRNGAFFLMDVLTSSGVNQHIETSLADLGTVVDEVATDGLAPATATTVQFFGGIGSIYFRWDEVPNHDPVTYRLHVVGVPTGSAVPTVPTDGTAEVVAGIGLTQAPARNALVAGVITPVVGDGTYTYYGVVTVEDADGPGPTSNMVSGIPVQVNSPDLALNAITVAHLLANDAFINALSAYDLSVVHSLVATGTTSFQNDVSLLDDMTMNATVAPPNVPPTLSVVDLSTKISGDQSDFLYGLTENSDTPGAGTKWITMGSSATGNGHTAHLVTEIDKVTGVCTNHTPTGIPTVGYTSGIVRLGGKYYALVDDDTATFKVYQIDPTTYAATYKWTYSGTNPNSLGTDGTNLIVAYNRSSDNKPVIRTFNRDTGAQIGSNLVVDTANDFEPFTCDKITGDFGAPRYLISTLVGSTWKIMLFDSSGVRQTADEWTSPAESMNGFYWDGTRLHSFGGSLVYHYSTKLTTSTVTATEVLTDGTASTAAGAASGSISWTKRRTLKVVVPPNPATPTGLFGKIYIGTTTTRRLQVLSPALSAINLVGYLDNLDVASAIAPTTQSGSFGTGGVGAVAAGAGGFRVDGNSNGSIGTGTLRDSITSLIGAQRLRLTKNAVQTISSLTSTQATFQTATVNVGSGTFSWTTAGAITVLVAGIYAINWGGQWPGANTGFNFEMGLLVNGSYQSLGGLQEGASGNNRLSQTSGSYVGYFSANDVLTFEVFHNATASQDLQNSGFTGTNPGTFAEVIRLA